MRHKGDITDWINWGISQGMEPKKFIEQLERAIHAAVDARKHSQSQQQPDNIDDVDAEKVVKLPKPDIIADEIAQDYRDKCLWYDEHHTWMAYELKLKGVWTPVGDMYVSVQVAQILQALNIKGYGVSYLNNIVKNLKRLLYTMEWVEDKNLLPFTDYVLELDTGKTREHFPGDRLTWVLPRPYNIVNQSWATIDNWLTEASLGNEQHKRILICFAAAVLRRRADLHKFLHLIGPMGTGKLTYGKLLTALVGQNNCASISLEELNEKDAIAPWRSYADRRFIRQSLSGVSRSGFSRS
jgi:phage/plasmid-associated DNA primase